MSTLTIVNMLVCIFLYHIVSLVASLVSNSGHQAIEEKLENEIINRSQIMLDKDSLEYRLVKLLDIHIGDNPRRSLAVNQQNNEVVPDPNSNQQYKSRNYSSQEFQHMFSALENSLKQIITTVSWKPCYEDYSIGTSYSGKTSLGINPQQLCPQPYTKILNQPPKNSVNKTLPTSCKEVQINGMKISGIYLIQPKKSQIPLMVLCDMETKGGGWTHIQKRFDGSQDFFLNYRDYKFGFGHIDGEFWLGLENIYRLTEGAWWYNACDKSNLNGKFMNVEVEAQYKYAGMAWDTFRGAEYFYPKARMMIRPVY